MNMLLFRRITGKDEEKPGSQGSSPSKSTIPNGDVGWASQGKPLEALRDYECAWPVTLSTRKRRSRLMPNLDETLHDRSARQHFLNFLHTRGAAAHLLQFWTEADSFEAVAKARLASHARHSLCWKGSAGCESPSHSVPSTADPCACPSTSVAACHPRCDGRAENHVSGSSPDASDSDHVHDVTYLTASAPTKPLNNNRQLAEKLWKRVEEDAVHIFSRHIAKDATFPIGIPDDLRDDVTRKICSETGCVDPCCFQAAREFVAKVLETQYFSDFVQSVHHCRHQVELLTSGEVCLADILHNEASLFYFMEFMELEGQRDILEFWLAADNFYQHLVDKQGNYNGSEAQDDAMVLYDRYFSLQATCPLGFSDAVRLEVEQNICREEGPLPICFERAVVIVLAVVDQVHLKQFLESQLYVKYLGELVNTVQSCDDDCNSQKKRTESDAESESSLQIVNTLLAMDGTRSGTTVRRIVQKFDGDAMRIDTGQFNPDALWRRQYAGKLRIGYVNEMGQFVSDLEPEPDKRRTAESILSKAVKKLVYKEEDKTKQDMALQVARMIIQDVLNVTMRNGLMNVTKS